VAIVESVERIPQEPFASVSATPSAALNQVREVMLIWPEIPSDAEVPAGAGPEESAGESDE
jgi:cell shape-determining protein MreC